MTASAPIVAPTRYARLACACNCAYGISSSDGKYTAPAIYDPAVGWTQGPTPFAARKTGDRVGPLINACLVGINGDGIVVAMRGTLPPAWTLAALEDWWQDIVDSEPVAAPPLKGKVHEGFWDALQTLWPNVLPEVQRLKTANPTLPIYVTGHSKGGPVASIGAALMRESANLAIEEVVTFASPHPGDSAFVDNYPSTIPVVRFENYLDVVPFVPPTDAFYQAVEKLIPASWQKEVCRWLPSLCKGLENAAAWDYMPLGTLHYVTKSGAVVGEDNPAANSELRLTAILFTLFGVGADSVLEEAIRLLEEPKLLESGLATIGAAHCMACKCDQPDDHCAGGYMTGAGGDPVCAAGG